MLYLPGSPTDSIYILAVNWPEEGDTSPKKLEISNKMAQNRPLTKVEIKVPSAGNDDYHQNQDFNLEKEDILVKPWQAVVVRVI
uniref:Glycosyl hydrolases family 38 C-terminal beta sandwich domain-containing protein n=1 Tax=Ditylenchus dipsaci TaxID=166011 RepID=A0A915E7B5_9BILA